MGINLVPGGRYSGAEDPTESGSGRRSSVIGGVGFPDLPAPIRVAVIAPASGAIPGTTATIGPAP